MNPLSTLLVKMIGFYQENFGARSLLVECNFTPTCSEYMKQSIIAHGVTRGFILGIKRLNRCRDRNLLKKIVDLVPR